jgi:hypothetical protein
LISSKISSRCCAALTAEEMFTKQLHQETDAEKEVLDLKRMQVRYKFIYLIEKKNI